jgi:hypothetical protein
MVLWLKVGWTEQALSVVSLIATASKQVWTWYWIHLIVDLIIFPSSPEPPRFDSVCDRGRLSPLEGVLLWKSSLRMSFALLVFFLVLKQNKSARASKV